MAKRLVPAALLDPVVAYFRPQRVILFGSRARGEAGPDSDIDLLVVLGDEAPPEKLTSQAGEEARRTYRRAADVFAMSAARFESERAIVGTIAAEADADGIVVYGPPKGMPPMKNPDPRARWRIVERWLDVADVDRRTAAACLDIDPRLRPSVAFHCQQAAEKLLKGFLVLAAKRFRKTHSLEELGALASADFPELAELVASLAGWTKWGIVYRYPADAPPAATPDQDELRHALGLIDRLAAQLRAKAPG